MSENIIEFLTGSGAYPFRDRDWILSGVYGGRLIKSADAAISAVGSDPSLCIDVLDAVYGDERLSNSIASFSWIDDVKLGRIGPEWNQERGAIAENAAQSFTEFWPSMRKRLNDAMLVAFVSAMENYVTSLLVEFPLVKRNSISSEADNERDFENLWEYANRAYRSAVKVSRSTSLAWVKLCVESSIPDDVKIDVEQLMHDQASQSIDEMVLLRNAIVHRAGLAGPHLAKLLGVNVGDRVYATDQRIVKYKEICLDFLNRIYPAL